LAGELVLVVDDRDDSLQFLTDYILQPNGYRFITAKNGTRGLELALSQDPALIIMDLKMPKMTGLEVLAALQERDVHIPVILMTFHGSEETAVQAFRLGARDYIIKPYDTTEMLQAIDRALTEVRLRRERDELHQGIMKINRQLEGRVKELQIIYSIGKSVTAQLDVEKLLSRIVQAGLYLTGAEEGSLLLIDKQTGDLYMRAARGLGEKFARGFRVKVQDSIAGQVVKTGEPYLDAGDAQALKVKTGYLVKSLLYVPLKLGTNVIGRLQKTTSICYRHWPIMQQSLFTMHSCSKRSKILTKSWKNASKNALANCARRNANWSNLRNWLRSDNWQPAWHTKSIIPLA
jgi:two-component system NtrC family sensor kinase